MFTRTLDNLQVSVNNLHIRFENNNPNFSSDKFSMGFTLQRLDISTTNDQWKPVFIDRTIPQNKNQTLYKILDIQNLGFYYKPFEKDFVSNIESQEDAALAAQNLFQIDQASIAQYEDFYLLQPMTVQTHLNIEPLNYKVKVSLDVGLLSICMTKNQLQNIVKLIELNHEYNEIQDTFQKQERKMHASNLARQNFDPKQQFDAMMLARSEVWAFQSKIEEQENFKTIVMGTELEELKIWTQQIVQQFSQQYNLQNQREQTQQSLGSYIRNYFKPMLQRQQQDQDDSDEFFDAVEVIEESKQDYTSLNGPAVQADFLLKEFNLILDSQIHIFSTGFTIQLLKYDDSRVDCRNSYELISRSQNFGIKSTDESAIIERKIQDQNPEWMSELKLVKRNVLFGQDDQLDVDLEIDAKMQPITYVHRPGQIAKFFDIFSFESVKDELKQKAQAKLEEIKIKVNESTKKALILSNKKTLVKVQVLCPVIELPFSNNEKIYKNSNQKWVIELGDLLFKNFDIQQQPSFKSFVLQLTDGFLKFQNEKKQQQVIDDLCLCLQINVNQNEPEWTIESKFSQVNLSLTPYLYCNLINIKELVVSSNGEQPARQNFEKLKCKSLRHGLLSKQGRQIKNWHQKYAVIVQDKIWFFEQDQFNSPECYQLRESAAFIFDEVFIEIQNSQQDKCILQFDSQLVCNQWLETLQLCCVSQIQEPDQQPASVKNIFSFEVPSINILLNGSKNELQPELGLNDPYDCGIFSLKDCDITQFNQILELKNLKFSRIMCNTQTQTTISLSGIDLKEQKCQTRFPFLLKSDQGLSVDIKQIERHCLDYKDVDMLVTVNIGCMDCNWKPRTLNRILRFVRFTKFKQNVVSLKQSPQHSGELKKSVMDCQTHFQTLINVQVQFDQLRIVFIHPNNDSYPIFTIVLDHTLIGYQYFFDHDVLTIKMGNLKVIDNTRYPRTLDSTRKYDKYDKIEQFEILSRRTTDDVQKDFMLEMQVLLLGNPGTCPLQSKENFQNFDKHVKIDVKTIRINFLMEYLLRVQDYILYQFIGSTSDSNPYQLLKDVDSQQTQQVFTDFISTQVKKITGLEINLSHPQIQLQDRFYLQRGKIRIDFGEIKIRNSTEPTQNRWLTNPNQKVMTNTVHLSGNGLCMKYFRADQSFTVLPNTNFKVDLQRINDSFLLSRLYMSDNFDFSEFDISQHLKIKLNPVKLFFTQEVYTYVLRCLDLNINYSDQQMKNFQLQIWNDPDSQKYVKIEAQTQQKYSGRTDVFRQKIKIQIPSMSLSLLDVNQSLVAELVFWNFDFRLEKLLDFRKEMMLKCHSLQILKTANKSNNGKNKVLIMGHMSIVNELVTDDDYYNFTVDNLIQQKKTAHCYQLKQRKKQLLQNNFEFYATLMPSGEKIIRCKFLQPKIFMRSHIFLKIQNFFSTAFPKYETDDKPNFYSGDSGNNSRQEIIVEMNQALICLENDEESPCTLAFQGSLTMTKAREKLNQVKLILLDRCQGDQFNQKNIDRSAKINILQLSLTDFSCYFCQTDDLNGKPFSLIKKRELTSPFNMHYNVNELIELKKKDKMRSQTTSSLEFITSKINEVSIDWTLLKISFKDMQTLQSILEYNQDLLNQTLNELRTETNDSFESDAESNVEESKLEILQLNSTVRKITARTSFIDTIRRLSLAQEFKRSSALDLSPFKLQTKFKEPLDDQSPPDEDLSETAGKVQMPESQIQTGFKRELIPCLGLKRFDDDNFLNQIEMRSGQNNVKVVSYGFKVLIINDNQGNFLPMFGLSQGEFLFQMNRVRNDLNGRTSLTNMVSYYNALAGSWEPLIENFTVQITYSSQNDLKQFTVFVEKEININITQSLLTTLKHTLQNINAEQYLHQAFKRQNAGLGIINFWEKGDIKSEEIIVTPYAICNMTESDVFIQRQNTTGIQPIHMKKFKSTFIVEETKVQNGIDKSVKVQSCSTADFAVDYEEQLKQQIDHYQQQSQTKEQMVSVQFDGSGKMEIPEINLNKIGQSSRHYYGSKKYKEFITYKVSFQNLKKVLTLRTQYLLENCTSNDYLVMIQSKFDLNQNETKMLRSGQMMPMPEIYNNSQIKIRLNQESEWSQELHIFALKKVIKPRQPGHLRHGNTFTIFKKIPEQDSFNIKLMPPLIVCNYLCQPINIQFESSNNSLEKITLDKQEIRNIFQFDLNKDVRMQVGVEGFNPQTLTLDPDAVEEKIIKLKLKDFRTDSDLSITVIQSTADAGFQVKFFISSCVINETGFNFNFFYAEPSKGIDLLKNDRNQQVPHPFTFNNCKVHMINLTKQIWAKVDRNPDVSQQIHTYAPGTKNKFCLIQNKKLLEFGYSTEMCLSSKLDFFYTKITTVSNLFVVVNCTNFDLLFAQAQQQKFAIRLKPNQNSPFFWQDKDSPLMACVRQDNNQVNFDWSSNFNLSEIGSVIVQNRQITNDFVKKITTQNENKTEISKFFSQFFKQPEVIRPSGKSLKQLFKVSCKYKGHQIFVIVEQEDPKLPAMKVENLCDNISIAFQQVGNQIQTEIDICDPQQHHAFAWSNLQGQKQLLIEFYQGNYSSKARKLETQINVSLDELNQAKREVILEGDQKIYVKVTTNGYTKILRFEQVDRDSEQQDFQVRTRFQTYLAQINLSVISQSTELFTAYFKEIKAHVEKSDQQLQCEFLLKAIHIDNQSETDPIYPVILKAQDPRTVRLQNGEVQVVQKEVFHLIFDMRLDIPNVLFFNLIEFLVQGIELRLEIAHLILLMEFFTTANKMFKREITQQHMIFLNNVQQKAEKSITDFQRKSVEIQKAKQTYTQQQRYGNVPSGIEQIYIREYKGSPISLNISLIKHGRFSEETMDQLSFLKTISSLGLTITSFENAPITMNALEIRNVFGDKEEVQEQLKGYYVQMARWNALNFLGASNLIGNPVAFINTLGTGVKDFYYEPVNGFMKGAREGGIGIVKGTGSLFVNTFLGSVSSIGKISSSLSSTVLSITGDEDFIQKRNMTMVKHKPRGFMQGLNQGVGGALQSSWSGLQGVIEMPNQGFKNNGTVGFFKGALQGAAGLFVKPISGAMDIVAKTSEGIHNSNKTQAELEQDQRVRQPRAFYGVEKVIQEYNSSHANLICMLPRMKANIDVSVFYDAWVIDQDTEIYDWNVVVLSKSQISRVAKFKNSKQLEAQYKKYPTLEKQGQSLTQVVKVWQLKEVTIFERPQGQAIVLKDESGLEIIETQVKSIAKSIFQQTQSVQSELQKEMIQAALTQQ